MIWNPFANCMVCQTFVFPTIHNCVATSIVGVVVWFQTFGTFSPNITQEVAKRQRKKRLMDRETNWWSMFDLSFTPRCKMFWTHVCWWILDSGYSWIFNQKFSPSVRFNFFSLSLSILFFLCIWINSILLWFMVNILTRTGFEWEWRVIVIRNHCEWGFLFRFHHFFHLIFSFYFHFHFFSLDLILCTVTGIVGNEERTWKGESKKESEVTIKPDYLCSTSGYIFFFIILLDEGNHYLHSFSFLLLSNSSFHSSFHLFRPPFFLSLSCPFHLS